MERAQIIQQLIENNRLLEMLLAGDDVVTLPPTPLPSTKKLTKKEIGDIALSEWFHKVRKKMCPGMATILRTNLLRKNVKIHS